MSSQPAQLIRLLALVPWLQNNPGVSAHEVALAFDISVEQVERDLNLLIVCGLPGGYHSDLIDIQFWSADEDDHFDPSSQVPANGLIHVLDPQTLTRPMALTRDEATTLLVGLNVLRGLTSGVDEDLVEGVINKLQVVAGAASSRADAISIYRSADEDSPVIAQALDEALTKSKQVEISYLVPTRDEVTERIVEPIRIVNTQGNQYLQAWCLLADGQRTFRLSRILSAHVLDQPCTPREIETVAANEVLLSDAAIPEVTIEVNAAGRWLAEYANVSDVIDLEGGGLRFGVRVADEQWIERMILQAGGNARLIAPRELADRIADRAAAGLAQYT